MSLQGNLETFALPDVLRFLSTSNKTGRLAVATHRCTGEVWMADGGVVAVTAGDATEPADGLFELLRNPEGTFDFDADADPGKDAKPCDVNDLLGSAEERLGEWRAIEAVVPSMTCAVHLATELGSDSVEVDRTTWSAVVAAATSDRVADVAAHLEMGEFEACRTVKDLVERGLLEIGPAAEVAQPSADAVDADADADEVGEAVEAAVDPGRARVLAVATDLHEIEDDPVDDEPADDSRWSDEPVGSIDDLDDDEIAERLAKVADDLDQAADQADGEDLAAVGAAGGAAPEGDDDPVNRGLLVKFLSSVQP